MLDVHRIDVTVAGSAGSATGTGTTATLVMGEIVGVGIVYTSQPATCDVAIADAGNGSFAQTILTVTNNATNGWYQPGKNFVNSSNSPIADSFCHFDIADYVTVSVSQGNPGTVTVYLKVRE